MELGLLEYQKTSDERFERIFDYMETREAPKQKVFFDGQVYDAFELLVSLVQKAEKGIVLVDGYVDVGTLNILAKKADGVDVTIWTRPNTRLTQLDIDTFNAQYPQLTVEHRKPDSYSAGLLALGQALVELGHHRRQSIPYGLPFHRGTFLTPRFSGHVKSPGSAVGSLLRKNRRGRDSPRSRRISGGGKRDGRTRR